MNRRKSAKSDVLRTHTVTLLVIMSRVAFYHSVSRVDKFCHVFAKNVTLSLRVCVYVVAVTVNWLVIPRLSSLL